MKFGRSKNPPRELTPEQVRDRQRRTNRLRKTTPKAHRRKSEKSRTGKLDTPWAVIVRYREWNPPR
jgi:hypothetical protein